METNPVGTTLLRVRDLLQRSDITGAIDLIEGLLPPDQADLFEELAPEAYQGFK